MKHKLSFQNLVAPEIQLVEDRMRRQADNYHLDLQAALDHLIESGGKRIRPNVTLLAGKLFNGNEERLITLSAAIELLHTATLVHDDLIDGSLLRRGIPTINARWSPAATVLTGDFLFAKAAELAADTDSLPVMKLFAQTLGIIVNGELTQMFSSKCNINRDEYYQRIYAKTASLFETSTTSAGIIAAADPDQIGFLKTYGYEIGIAFQIVDDILDFTSQEEKLGKPVGGDLRQGLVTLPTIYFVENNPGTPLVKRYFFENCSLSSTEMKDLICAIKESEAIEASLVKAKQHIQRGLDALINLPENKYRDSLEEIAYYITERDL